ncbi:MAG: hypothetical protein ABIK65_05265 [Candidatus Eisenbacteria bacterium]
MTRHGKMGALALIAGAAMFAGTAAAQTGVSCFSQAQTESEGVGLPILLEVGVSWSEGALDFEDAVRTDEAMSAAIRDHVVLCRLDAETGEDGELAKAYGVRNYPTFILTNARGDLIDQWYGFGCRRCFVMRLERAVGDPVTLAYRLKRFRAEPSEEDARRIGEVRHSQGMFAEAVAYFQRAKELAGDSETNYDMKIFNAIAYGYGDGIYGDDLVKAQADVVYDSPRSTLHDRMKVASSMFKVAKRSGDDSYFVPYLRRAVEESEGVTEEDVAGMRAKLLPEYALRVEKDPVRAAALYKGNQPGLWQEDGVLLNEFAWWCFENRINLKEAEALARRGVELAAPGKERANLLDTLAEICNVSGECEGAVKFIRMAIAEAPDNEHFRRQLARFEEILAARR